MSHQTPQERIQELINKIQDLRKNKLYHIEYIEKETTKIVDTLKTMDTKIADLITKIETGSYDAKQAMLLLKAFDTRKVTLEGYKSTLKECRLIITLLIKEEGKLQYELVKAKSEVR